MADEASVPAQASHRFVLVGDSCSGIPGGPHEATFAAISRHIAAIDPEPDFICFLGDHIQGLTSDEASLRAQWRYWCEHEFGWTKSRSFPVYHLTSNHNTYDAVSERVFCEVFPDLPRNGPADDLGRSYYVLRDDLLLVFTNSATARLGPGRIETDWLAEVLARHRGVPQKLVFGHYPVLPVNGYTQFPLWRIPPEQGDTLWRLLVEHDVMAYVCSHVIAYDVRVRDGVLQICSAGAGTRYGPTGDFMRGGSEFFHFMICELDEGELHCHVVDESGNQRRQLHWPLARIDAPAVPSPGQGVQSTSGLGVPENVARLRFEIEIARSGDVLASTDRETLLCGYDVDEGPPTIWLGLECGRLVAEIVLWPGGPLGRWVVDSPADFARASIEIVPALGPGGLLGTLDEGLPSSLMTTVAEDLDRIRWPRHWCLGHGPSGESDEPFHGRVAATYACAAEGQER